MNRTLTVEARVAGQRRPVVPARQIPLPPETEAGAPLTLGQLITRVVAAEVAAFRERQEARRFVQVLGPAEIAAAAARGKVDMGGRETAAEVDLDGAVTTALQAFEDGLYYVFVDDAQQTRLDQEVPLRPDSHVLFLRLVALAGG